MTAIYMECNRCNSTFFISFLFSIPCRLIRHVNMIFIIIYEYNAI